MHTRHSEDRRPSANEVHVKLVGWGRWGEVVGIVGRVEAVVGEGGRDSTGCGAITATFTVG